MENNRDEWYSVHAILYFEDREGKQDGFLVWEHIYLIRAASPDQARERGELRARQDESDDDSLTLDGRPSRLRFAGIRQIVECQDPDGQNRMPADGTELSYTEFYVSKESEFSKLVNGKSAEVLYQGEEEGSSE